MAKDSISTGKVSFSTLEKTYVKLYDGIKRDKVMQCRVSQGLPLSPLLFFLYIKTPIQVLKLYFRSTKDMAILTIYSTASKTVATA